MMRPSTQPIFAKRHYEWLASWLRYQYPFPLHRKLLAVSLAGALATENPQFNPDKFLAACGLK